MTSGRIIRPEAEIGPSKLPLLGKLAIGAKAKNAQGKEHPISLDYFLARGKYAELFHKVYGPKPSKVEIVFYSNDPREACSERYECRDDKGRLTAEGDGVTWRCWSKKREEYVFGESTLDKVQADYGEAKKVLTLRFILPRIPRVWGIWSLSTKGKASSIDALRDTYDQVLAQAGLITNIPFDLMVEKVKSNKPGVTSVFPVLTLVPNLSQENMDLLSEFVAGGTQRLRGVFTEEKIKKLAAAAGAETEVEPTPSAPALPAAPEPAPHVEPEKVDEPTPTPAEDLDDGPGPEDDDEGGADAIGSLLDLK